MVDEVLTFYTESFNKAWSNAAREASAAARRTAGSKPAKTFLVRQDKDQYGTPRWQVGQDVHGDAAFYTKDFAQHHFDKMIARGRTPVFEGTAVEPKTHQEGKALVTESIPLTFYSEEEIAAWEMLSKAAKPGKKSSGVKVTVSGMPADADTGADDSQDNEDAGAMGAMKSQAQQQADDMAPDDAVDHIANNPPPWLPAAQVPAWQAVVRSGAHTDYHSATNHLHNLVNKFLVNLKPKKKTKMDLMSTDSGKAGSATPTPQGPANQGTN